jgi:hypothetical protein
MYRTASGTAILVADNSPDSRPFQFLDHTGNVLLFPRDTDIRHDLQPVQCRERLGGLLRYYHQEAA